MEPSAHTITIIYKILKTITIKVTNQVGI